ncbi:phosphoserine transaminase [Roseomonas alkaliterrae]|uniref:phosphoserine transaminase n=1 Tax=Neoroseomonas alkaliterrae TaxID=1452450 RepID=A0A840XUJ7_9PROT|nr:phosphoserine transaminase [Neoroseomonas alkaliterrae]MBB5691566.1 phosphoserine aminotransferase [Neoroseomonas alkaliterrae]MBR0677073.1 phosphoserine transaminase [Neoroseomonas alkaliterrae]
MANAIPTPGIRPANPRFSSGPCAKRPGWSLAALEGALLGRSHRAKEPKAKLAEVIERSKAILGMPADWRLGIVPASDTGAVEMALWSLLGPRGVDILAWESFSKDWATDVVKQLRLPDARVIEAPYGRLPDLSQVDAARRDVVFVWNGTTSGVRLPDADFIPVEREGLSICDATSAAFAMELPWDRLDVVTWSWQKVLGGEAAHGMLALSPRAVARLESHSPAWPMPKIFRMTKGGKLNEGIFKGETINTPSMLCVEDALDGLRWAESVGGLKGLVARSEANLAAIARWVATNPGYGFLAEDPATRSCTSICLTITAPWFTVMGAEAQAAAAKKIASLLEKEGVALDAGAYRDAPPGLRIWGGATVETSDIEALLPWLDWALAVVESEVVVA